MIRTLCVLLLANLLTTRSFLLPGVAPSDYSPGAVVDVKVNSLTSIKTQLPVDYYSLQYCRPMTVNVAIDNLGEFLSGERLHNSAYEMYMLANQDCKLICQKIINQRGMERFREAIDEE